MTTREHWVAINIEKLSECETVEQMNDALKPLRSSDEVLDKPITITSVRPRQSDYRDRPYAVVGYQSDVIGDGQFKIGGGAGKWILAARHRLPMTVTLRREAWNGHNTYRWEQR